MKGYAYLILACVLVLASCSHKIAEDVHSNERFENKALHSMNRLDSIFVKDYVYVDRNTYIKGDTVYKTRDSIVYRTKWRTKKLTDTVYQDKDSIVYKDRLVTRTKTEIAWGWMLVAAVGGFIVAVSLMNRK